MKILIIEDEYSLADMIRDSLEKEKYMVDLALNGEDGLYRAETEIYDIIILDVMLPKLSGFEVLKQLRKSNSTVAVLMLTAKTELEDKLFGLDSGADDYMTKPFAMKELLARVRVLIRRHRKAEDEKLCFKDLNLEPNLFKLSCSSSGMEVVLGSKEYLLMEYLLLNANRILSKEQISTKIWGYDSNVEYNNAEVYISFLRKKIAYLKSQIRIKTIRGIGYCLEEDTGEI